MSRPAARFAPPRTRPLLPHVVPARAGLREHTESGPALCPSLNQVRNDGHAQRTTARAPVLRQLRARDPLTRTEEPPVMTALHDGWTLRPLEGPVPPGLQDRAVPATVPGCVHTDLLGAGLIPDPYLDENERLLEWVGRTSWRFTTTFRAAAAAAGERVDLDFGGLDTVATVTLNGCRPRRDEEHAPRPPLRRAVTSCVDGDNELHRRLRRPDRRGRADEPAARAPARTPTVTPSTSSARWPATSAGTGVPSWSRPASGGRSPCTGGTRHGWPRCGRS